MNLTAQTLVRKTAKSVGVALPDSDVIAGDSPADFIERYMLDVDTGNRITLHPEQRAVLELMAARNERGFIYSTWVYSAPKKSAKTTIGAGVALWQAYRVPNGEVYVIGNDLKQADSRMAQVIRYTVLHHPLMRNRVKVSTSQYKITLPNGARIEAIPVDPRGESGMNPTGLFWTEAWGAYGTAAEALWSEATLSPTRAGESFKFIESYAGYSGVSTVLERIYDGVVRQGVPHPTQPEIYTNASSIAYWCTRRYLEWQTTEAAKLYYQQEAIEKTPDEYRRVHGNEWVSAQQAFVPLEWWNACKVNTVDFPQRLPMVLSIDAAVSGDCFAIIGVSRWQGRVYVRYLRIWKPNGAHINFKEPQDEIRRLVNQYNVECCVYDPHELELFAQELTAEGRVYMKPFGQTSPRLEADKALYDAIRERIIAHFGEPDLTSHIMNADVEIDKHERKMRIVKRSSLLKIDATVALSMAHDTLQALEL